MNCHILSEKGLELTILCVRDRALRALDKNYLNSALECINLLREFGATGIKHAEQLQVWYDQQAAMEK